MRYDTPIYFQKVAPGEFDPMTGNHAEEVIKEFKRIASVTDTGTETQKLLFDDVREGCKTIKLQVAFDGEFDRIRIGETVYKVHFERKLLIKQNFVVKEI